MSTTNTEDLSMFEAISILIEVITHHITMIKVNATATMLQDFLGRNTTSSLEHL
ncbi:hypothetical protein A2U01_0063676, partial [Trifolium medium]|nr:hypothetical protein [Trifolium medium]